MIEQPQDVKLRYLLAAAYNANGAFDSAIRILSATGQPDVLLERRVRSAADIEGFYALVNALAGAGQVGLARELALFRANEPWVTTPDWWNKTYGSCGLAILERDEEALRGLESVKESPRLPWLPVLKDSYCFKRYEGADLYQELLAHVEEKQRAALERLPTTLTEFAVSLDQLPSK